ncbi:hypothetical protein DIPPA_34712 [Diplonema papillatum]|nr:hypothetical protein DIPPA_34712 [Diplonema papillatum]
MGCECSKPDEVPRAKSGKKLQPPVVTVEGVRIDDEDDNDDDQPSKKKYTSWVKDKKNRSGGSRGGLLPAGDAGAANDDAYSCVDGISCATTALLSITAYQESITGGRPSRFENAQRKRTPRC